VLASIDVVLVDLVGDDPQLLSAGPLDERLDPRTRDHPTGGVARRAEIDGDRRGRQVASDGLDCRLRRIRHAQEGNRHRTTPVALNDPGDQRPVGRQDQDLVVGLENRAHHCAESPGRPGSDQDVGGFGGYAGSPADPLDDGVE